MRAVEWCAEYARHIDAEVYAVYALEPAFYGGYAGLAAMSMPIVLTSDQRDAIAEVVRDQWCAPLAAAKVKFHALVVDGSPSSTLIQVAEQHDAALVAVGRRGRGGFVELIVGSTSHQLTHHLHRPLVIVP